ncbi:MAG: hypothetical protein PVH31_00755 [Ectothiorhodospiraceae bacterium]|jgi:ElaB/YqjD/DUF883 family membrane-anchored ribosome-binding protein
MATDTTTPQDRFQGAEAPNRHQTTDRFAEKAHEAVDRAAERGGRAEERIRETGERAAHRFEETRDRATEQGRDLYEEIGGYVRRNPYTSIGIAAAAGFVLGKLLRR